MNNFDSNISRVRNLLQYGSPQDAMATLVESGISPEEAYLLIKAAQVVPVDRSPIPACACCGIADGQHKMSCSFLK